MKCRLITSVDLWPQHGLEHCLQGDLNVQLVSTRELHIDGLVTGHHIPCVIHALDPHRVLVHDVCAIRLDTKSHTQSIHSVTGSESNYLLRGDNMLWMKTALGLTANKDKSLSYLFSFKSMVKYIFYSVIYLAIKKQLWLCGIQLFKQDSTDTKIDWFWLVNSHYQ